MKYGLFRAVLRTVRFRDGVFSTTIKLSSGNLTSGFHIQNLVQGGFFRSKPCMPTALGVGLRHL
jgi:hypothetical protein